MKKRDLLILAFLPTVAGIVLFNLVVLPGGSEAALYGLQTVLSVALLAGWYGVGRWAAGQDKRPWPVFALLQWWGAVSVVFGFAPSVGVLGSLSQMYGACMSLLLTPTADLLGGAYLPLQAFLTLALTSAAYLLGFAAKQRRSL